jgi:pyrimidine-specific ribonucleoside hydrolase
MIKNIRILVLLLSILFFLITPAQAHTIGKQAIVDTDAALDDLRALSMLFNSQVVDIRLVTTSDGVLSPERGAHHVHKLLTHLHQHVPIVSGEVYQASGPEWRKWNSRLEWPDRQDRTADGEGIKKNAAQQMSRFLKEMDNPVLLICLGPLSNVAQAIDHLPRPEKEISRIVYFGGPPDSESPGWNTERDPKAAQKVFAADIPISCIHPSPQAVPTLTQAMIRRMEAIDSRAAEVLTPLHQGDEVQRLVQESHLRMWDDLLSLYLAFPDMFHSQSKDFGELVALGEVEPKGIREQALQLLQPDVRLHIAERKPVILRSFPQRPEMLRDDARSYAERIIRQHGLEEWKACLLTSELHRHLGTYSIVGAKMGLRAREILKAPLGRIEVISLAGEDPPLSCLNDGLQVSTGASLGRGKISVSDASPQPAAIFFSNGRQLKLRLKEKPARKIRSSIRKAKERYGGLNRSYFRQIRRKSLQNWLELDRREIFESSFL